MGLPKFLKKLFSQHKIALILLLTLLLSTLAAKPILGYSTQPPPGYHLSFENAVFYTDEMNLQSFVFETLKATISSLISFFYCFTCPADQRGGLLSLTGGLIAGIYANPPASGVNYLAYMGQKFNIASPTYAQEQGVGFEEMRPYLAIWTKFRDLSYGLFIIIFIFIGFAIMFRIKISPQAVVTIESALPKLIIALLLITFSYAVVGFMIDIMMVVSNLIVFTFKSLPDLPSFYSDKIPAETFTDAPHLLSTILAVGIPPILLSFLVLFLLGLISIGIGALTAGAGTIVGIGVLIAGLILAVIFFIALLRLLWTLLKAYVMVVLSLIFSPFIILVGSLPGSNAISGWFRNILANLAVLPTVLAMVFLSGYLTIVAWIPIFGDTIGAFFLNIINPTEQIQRMQETVASNPNPMGFINAVVLSLVSLVILLLTPRAADIIQSFLSGQPFAYGTALGEYARTAWVSPIGGLGRHEVGTRFARAWPQMPKGFRQEITKSIASWMRSMKWY